VQPYLGLSLVSARSLEIWFGRGRIENMDGAEILNVHFIVERERDRHCLVPVYESS
jgi:hypothetical protein